MKKYLPKENKTILKDNNYLSLSYQDILQEFSGNFYIYLIIIKFSAIVSHPADTMVSKLYSAKTGGSVSENVSRIYGEIGFNGLWVKTYKLIKF